MRRKSDSTPLLLLPLVALWRLVAGVVGLTGRLIAILLGMALLIVGAILTVTVIGAVVGIPLMLFGIMLILRGLF